MRAFRPSSLVPRPPSALRLPPSAFTLVELLVTIVIIGILAAMMLGALSASQNTAKEMATKATIAKLNGIIMERYESYMTRRVPIAILPGTPPPQAALLRLRALRHLMRMEMPDSFSDIRDYPSVTVLPVNIAAGVTLSEPALHAIYAPSIPTTGNDYESAICLYKVVSMGSPEAMEQFNSSEIGTVTSGGQNCPVFIDGWGTPICWLRWAPGCSSRAPFNGFSDIQTGDAGSDPDPFDPRRIDVGVTGPRAYHMIPLICSAGTDKTFGLVEFPSSGALGRNTILGKTAPLTPFNPDIIFDIATYSAFGTVGGPSTGADAGTHHDNITNHHIEMR